MGGGSGPAAQKEEVPVDADKPATVAGEQEEPIARETQVRKRVEVGQIVDGKVVRRLSMGVFLDIGASRPALLKAPPEEAFKLEPKEKLKGLRVESVQPGEYEKIEVSFAGLTELVSGRPERPSAGKLKKASAEVGEAEKKSTAEAKTKKKPTRETESLVQIVPPIWVLDAKDLEGRKGAKFVVELRGGLAIASTDNKNHTITLVKSVGTSAGPSATGKKKSKSKAYGEAKQVAQDPFADLVEGQSLKGRVRNKNNLGVWVDVGRVKDVLIAANDKTRLLDWGEELTVVVDELDHELGYATATVPDLEKHVAGRGEKLVELTDLEVGSTVTGHVASIRKKFGGFVDIGAERDVLIPFRQMRTRLQLGQEVKVKLDSVDLDKRRMQASLA